MSARPDFKDARTKLTLKALDHIFPRGEPATIGATIAPNVVIFFISANHAEIGILFQGSVTFNVTSVVVDDVNRRCFHVISFPDD
jgi:hypothetical protein